MGGLGCLTGILKTWNNNLPPDLQRLASLWLCLGMGEGTSALSGECALWGKTANQLRDGWEVGGFVEGFFESTVGLHFQSFVCVGGSSFCFVLRRGGLEFVFK